MTPKQKYGKKHYENNKEKYKKSKLNIRNRNRIFFKTYMKDKKCTKCNKTNDEITLHNHHTNKDDPERRDNKKGIYFMVNNGFSIQSILIELKKTIVLCVDCHGEITRSQDNIINK